MVKVEELAEVVEENEQYVGGVRYIAEYMAKNNYCCDVESVIDCRCERHKVEKQCVKCWMINLTNEVKGENK